MVMFYYFIISIRCCRPRLKAVHVAECPKPSHWHLPVHQPLHPPQLHPTHSKRRRTWRWNKRMGKSAWALKKPTWQHGLSFMRVDIKCINVWKTMIHVCQDLKSLILGMVITPWIIRNPVNECRNTYDTNAVACCLTSCVIPSILKLLGNNMQ